MLLWHMQLFLSSVTFDMWYLPICQMGNLSWSKKPQIVIFCLFVTWSLSKVWLNATSHILNISFYIFHTTPNLSLLLCILPNDDQILHHKEHNRKMHFQTTQLTYLRFYWKKYLSRSFQLLLVQKKLQNCKQTW